MCFLFTNPDLIIDEPELQSANLNTDKRGDTLSQNEASPTHQRYEPRDLKDLTGHTFGTIPPDFKPVLTIPWTERPDRGISELPADLTIIERFTTVTQSEQSITTSSPPRLTPGTEIEIITIIDGTKFIPPSSTSDVTSPSQESEYTSPKETTTEGLSLSTETTLLASSSDRPRSNMNCNLNRDINRDMSRDMNCKMDCSMGGQLMYLSLSARTMRRYSHNKRFRKMGGKLEELNDSMRH
ncbi:hypothetical protein FPCIR_12483 [Fusarium pseudocircinatum]|uniref:Uncharacterized protein n=1 Tax=Fusarium pseudocircinatum TaxID=56676 RepID=A0A8H5KNT1_9HYPO|nr:hypothetical protein FPCIR_12483 [Fusarium pseudocircinatum]